MINSKKLAIKDILEAESIIQLFLWQLKVYIR
jgi:hypothetical protein